MPNVSMATWYSAPPVIWDPPPLLHTLFNQPVKTLCRLLDVFFSYFSTSPQPLAPPLRVICISDTHCLKDPNIPDGDLLIHAGDLANDGTADEIQTQIDWLTSLPHEHKVVIAGNHDRYLDPRRRVLMLETTGKEDPIDWKGIHYLQHSKTILKFKNGRELRVYGAPQTPVYGRIKMDDHAFRYTDGADAWSDTIPRDIDVLVTHGPPKYHLDLPVALGCEHLLNEVWKVQPKLYVFGHVHAGKTDFVGRLRGGREVVKWDGRQKCLERALRRPDGFFRGLLDPRAWIDVAGILRYGIIGLLWDGLWGGEIQQSTQMVLASLMYCSTGRLGNSAQVVEI